MNFNRATDLDPKGASNQIKEAIDPTNNQSPLDDSGMLFSFIFILFYNFFVILLNNILILT